MYRENIFKIMAIALIVSQFSAQLFGSGQSPRGRQINSTDFAVLAAAFGSENPNVLAMASAALPAGHSDPVVAAAGQDIQAALKKATQEKQKPLELVTVDRVEKVSKQNAINVFYALHGSVQDGHSSHFATKLTELYSNRGNRIQVIGEGRAFIEGDNGGKPQFEELARQAAKEAVKSSGKQ